MKTNEGFYNRERRSSEIRNSNPADKESRMVVSELTAASGCPFQLPIGSMFDRLEAMNCNPLRIGIGFRNNP